MFVPGIPGEVADVAHTNWIALSSFSEQQVSGLIAPGVKSYAFGINKNLDRSSPTLMLRVAQQTKLGPVHLQMVDNAATNNVYDIYLTNAVVTGLSQTGGFSGPAAEALNIQFEQIRWTYTFGSGKGLTTVSASEDLTQTNNPPANQTYQGNGSTTSGGAIGGGTLVFTNDAQTIYGTFTRGSGTFSDVLVLYIDNGSGGFPDTSGFNDSSDPITRSVSGINGSGNRSLLTFTNVPFSPAYAIALAPIVGAGSGNIYRLENGDAGSEQFLGAANLMPLGTGNASTYRFSFGMSQIALSPFIGQTFRFLGTYVSTTGARSSEAIGGNVSGVDGWNPFTTVNVATYTITAPAANAVAISLTYDPQAGTVTFYWPVTLTPYVLQQNADLGTNLWVTVTNSPTVVSNQNQVVLPASVSSPSFYRLKY